MRGPLKGPRVPMVRDTPARTVTNHEVRLKTLERRQQPSGSGSGGVFAWEDVGDAITINEGIDFEVHNVGAWLDITTTSYDVGGSGAGIHLDTGINPMSFESGGFSLIATSGVSFIGADFSFYGLDYPTSDFVVNVSEGVLLTSADVGSMSMGVGAGIQLSTNDDPIVFVAQGASQDITAWPTAGSFIVKGKVPLEASHRAILRVTHDPTGAAEPTYHIRAGATWTADL